MTRARLPASAANAPRSRGRRRSATRNSTKRQRPRAWLLIGVGGLVIAGAAVAAVLVGGSAGIDSNIGPTQGPGVTAPTVSGGHLPSFAGSTGDPAEDPAVGRAIPLVAGSSFDGVPVQIEADGRPKILLFLAHWCSHCQAEVPVVQRWLDAGRLPVAVDLISIATSIDPTRPNYPPDAWLARQHWTAPVIVDPREDVAARYGLGAFPYWVAVAADGTVTQRLTGELTEGQLDELAASLGS
jgi:thiol-disulfide isomerase/thioredoxin